MSLISETNLPAAALARGQNAAFRLSDGLKDTKLAPRLRHKPTVAGFTETEKALGPPTWPKDTKDGGVSVSAHGQGSVSFGLQVHGNRKILTRSIARPWAKRAFLSLTAETNPSLRPSPVAQTRANGPKDTKVGSAHMAGLCPLDVLSAHRILTRLLARPW